MIRLTNLADYAVLLMAEIAKASLAENNLGATAFIVSAQELADKTKLPVPAVAKILNQLAHRGLLVSKRGLYGGFSLARRAEDISVAAIVEAIDGPIALTHCIGQDLGDCAIDHSCQMRPRWHLINETVRKALEAVSLALILAENKEDARVKSL